jgi:hypothetical protein
MLELDGVVQLIGICAHEQDLNDYTKSYGTRYMNINQAGEENMM